MDSKYSKDEVFLKRIRDGDLKLLKELHQTYWQSFGPFFFKRGDLSQREVLDIYASAFAEFDYKIREQKLVAPLRSSLKTYLFGIGNNLVSRHFQKKKRNKETSTEELDLIPMAFQTPTVDDQYQQEALTTKIKKLLLQLGPDCQHLIRLSYLEENVDDAIAAKMNIPSSGAVRQRRFKCLEKLRKLFRQ